MWNLKFNQHLFLVLKILTVRTCSFKCKRPEFENELKYPTVIGIEQSLKNVKEI